MPEHVHLLIFPSHAQYDIADIRKAIKAPVGRKGISWLEEHAPHWLPKVTRKRGAKTERLFWQSGGGYDRNVVEPKTLARMIDYIHLNPVRRELVDLPDQWHWSSAAWYTNQGHVPISLDSIPPEWFDSVE